MGLELPIADPGPVTAVVDVGVYDTNGEERRLDQQTVSVTPVAGASTVTVEVLSRFAGLRPDGYEVRASASVDGKVGSVFTQVTVDDFSRQPLGMSGVLLETPGAPRLVAATNPTEWLPVRPTLQRAFAPTDRVTAGVRLFQPRRVAEAPVVLEATIVDAAGDIVATIPGTLASTAFSADRLADYRVDLPLTTLASGDYLLRLTATLDRRTLERTARFEVR